MSVLAVVLAVILTIEISAGVSDLFSAWADRIQYHTERLRAELRQELGTPTSREGSV